MNYVPTKGAACVVLYRQRQSGVCLFHCKFTQKIRHAAHFPPFSLDCLIAHTAFRVMFYQINCHIFYAIQVVGNRHSALRRGIQGVFCASN